MGWIGGDLKPLAAWLVLLLAPAMATAAEPATPEPQKLSAEEQELLQILDLLEDLELLEDWDPAEGLPIPLAAPPPGDAP